LLTQYKDVFVKKKLLFLALSVVFSFNLFSGEEKSLSLDASIKTGTLDNGFKYYIQHNDEEKGRASLRLIVKVGSVNELEGEQGLAHFVQLMNFRGTAHYPTGTIRSFLDSIGAKISKEISLHTYFDKTTYRINIPLDNEETVKKVLCLYSDWIGGRSLITPPEVEEERGIILQKWLFSRIGRQRYHDQRLAAMVEESSYANRSPFGKEEVIRSCTYQDVRAFYHRWYSPRVSAVIAVGDFKVDSIEKLIKEYFSDLENPLLEGENPSLEIPKQDGIRFAICQDPEVSTSELAINFKRKLRGCDSFEVLQEQVETELVHLMIDARMSEMSHGELSPFLGVECISYPLTQSMEILEIDAKCLEEGVLDGLERLLVEIKRIKEYGFTSGEFQRARAEYMARLDKMYNDALRPSQHAVGKLCMDSFMNNMLTYDSVKQIDLLQNFLRKVTLDKVSEQASLLLNENKCLISTFTPEQGKLGKLEEADFKNVIANVQETEIDKWCDSIPKGQLFPYVAKSGKIVSTQSYQTTQMKEYHLENGMRVFYMPTDSHSGEVVIRAVAEGGVNYLQKKEFNAGVLLSDFSNDSGVGEFNKSEFEKLLKGKQLTFNSSVNISSREINIEVPSKDLETAMQMINLAFTEEVNFSDSFPLVMKRKKEEIQNQNNNPLTAFIHKTLSLNTNNHPLFTPLSHDKLIEVKQKESEEIFAKCFADLSEFTLFIAGDISQHYLEKLLENYLAGVPKRNSGLVDNHEFDLSFIKGIKKEAIFRGVEQASKVQISFPINLKDSEERIFDVNQTCILLKYRLNKVLRDKLSATWNVSVDYNFPLLPMTEFGFISVSFDCATKQTERLLFSVFKELDKLIKKGPSEEDLRYVQHSLKEDNVFFNKNEYTIISSMILHYQMFKDISSMWKNKEEQIFSLSTENLRAGVEEFFSLDNYTLVTMYPEDV
jgi:zinc protease